MRSRFSAYVIQDYQYILQSYASKQRANLTINDLRDNAQDTNWLSLNVLDSHSKEFTAQVEFKAFYQIDTQFYVLHEISDFILENNKWYYQQGVIQKDSGLYSLKRNDPCLCNSGKKYKKCCGA